MRATPGRGTSRSSPAPSLGWAARAPSPDEWLTAADIAHGQLFHCVCRTGIIWGTEITEKVVRHVVKQYAGILGIIHMPGKR